jgi:hypothetical protein
LIIGISLFSQSLKVQYCQSSNLLNRDSSSSNLAGLASMSSKGSNSNLSLYNQQTGMNTPHGSGHQNQHHQHHHHHHHHQAGNSKASARQSQESLQPQISSPLMQPQHLLGLMLAAPTFFSQQNLATQVPSLMNNFMQPPQFNRSKSGSSLHQSENDSHQSRRNFAQQQQQGQQHHHHSHERSFSHREGVGPNNNNNGRANFASRPREEKGRGRALRDRSRSRSPINKNRRR